MNTLAKLIAYTMYGWYMARRWFHVQVVARLTTPSARTFVTQYVSDATKSVTVDVYSSYCHMATAVFSLTNVTLRNGRMWRLEQVNNTLRNAHDYQTALRVDANSGGLLTETLDGVAEEQGWFRTPLRIDG